MAAIRGGIPIKHDLDIPVLIVGAGPVGLSASIELAWRGIGSALIERRDGEVRHPKMNQVGVRTVEHCRRWGIARKVRESSVPEDFPRNIRFLTAAAGHQLAHYEFPARKDEPCINSPEAIQRCSQIYFDPILRDHAMELGGAANLYSHELDEVSQDAGGVTARVTDIGTGATKLIRARYMIACDGAESGVRDQLGIGLEGDMSMNYNVNAFFRSEDHDALFRHGRCVMQWMIDGEGVWADIVSINGKDLWRFSLMRVPGGEVPSFEEMSRELCRAAGREIEHEIYSVLPWERRRVVAERFQEGRILLAGDAVHQMSPTGGFGMNTGIQEAVDAAWKIAARLEGWGGDALVASYDAERRPVAWTIVDEAARNFTQFSKLPGGAEDVTAPEGRGLRKRIGETIYAERFDREYEMEGVPLGYRYEGSPVIVPDGTPEPPFEVMNYTPTARPGHRAPHAWLDGETSTLDLFGRGFTLLSFDGAGTAELESAAADRGVPLSVRDIRNDHIAALYGQPLVLVRPDGHVAWRGDALPPDCGQMVDIVRGA